MAQMYVLYNSGGENPGEDPSEESAFTMTEDSMRWYGHRFYKRCAKQLYLLDKGHGDGTLSDRGLCDLVCSRLEVLDIKKLQRQSNGGTLLSRFSGK